MDIDELDLNLLRILEGLYSLGTVSAVAARSGVSQPAVSNGLAKLRVFFNDDLFVRTGHGMRPTPFAEELRRPVLETLDAMRTQILRKTAFEPAHTRRTFTLCMSDIGQLLILPRLHGVFGRAAPHAALRCVGLETSELKAGLEEGRVDLAIGDYPELEGGSLVVQRLFAHPFVCLVREGHPVIGAVLDLESFRNADHIVLTQPGRAPDVPELLLREIGLEGRVGLRLSSYLAAPALVAQSDMICMAPQALARICGPGSGVRVLAPPISQTPTPLRQFWHRRLHSDAGLMWLRSVVAREFLNQPPSPEAPRA